MPHEMPKSQPKYKHHYMNCADFSFPDTPFHEKHTTSTSQDFPLWVSAQTPERSSSAPSALPSWSCDSGRHPSTAPWHGVRPRDAARWRPRWSPVLQHPGATRDPADRGWSHLRGCRLERQEGALNMTGLLLCVFFAAGRYQLYLIAFLEGGYSSIFGWWLEENKVKVHMSRG